jgi:hypothetical protein
VSPGDARFTRRAVLGGAAAAGAGVLVAPAAALALVRSPSGASVFDHRLGDLAGVSRVIKPGRRFVLAGVQWSGPPAPRIEVRAGSSGGGWSRWALASVSGHEPDRAVASDARFGEPLWFGPADRIQLRTQGPVRGVRLHFVAESAVAGRPADAALAGRLAGSPGRAAAATATELPIVAPPLPAGPGQPPIIARSAWAGRRDGPAGGPYYGSVQMAIVHHTENPNGYSAGDVPAMLKAMYDYHRFTRGYFDIAYNFVIDAFGRIWEARAGGVDEPVIGAHAGGFNSVSTGVAILGTFMVTVPPPPAITALQQLLAWKLALHGVPALGTVRVKVAPADAFYTSFRPGQRVLLPRVAGHRDGDRTDCPGNDFYGRLPAIRANVDLLAGEPVQLTLSASPTTMALGAPVTLSGGFAAAHGEPVAAAPLEIQSVSGIGVLTTLATVTTGADGTWSTTALTLTRSALVRALHQVSPAAVSDLVAVAVMPVITLALASAPASPLRVSGTVAPAKRSVTIRVHKLAGPHRRLVLTKRVTVRRGSFATRLNLGRAARGNYLIVARTAADTFTAAGASPPLSVLV